MYQRNGLSRILGGAAVIFCSMLLLFTLVIVPSTIATGTGGGPLPPDSPVSGDDSTDTGSSLNPETEPEIPSDVELIIFIVKVIS